MGLFNMFKKAGGEDKAKARRDHMVYRLEQIKSRIPNDKIDVIRNVNSYIDRMDRQPVSGDANLLYADALINSIISDIENDLTKGYFNVAKVRFSALDEALSYRESTASSGGSSLNTAKQQRIAKAAQKELNKEMKEKDLTVENVKIEISAKYDNEQLFDISVNKKQDEIDMVQKDIDKLMEKQNDGTFTQADMMKLQLKQRELQMKQNSFKATSSSQMRDASLKMMESFNEEQKQNISNYSDEEMNLIMNTYQKNLEKMNEEDPTAKFFGSGSQMSFGSTSNMGMGSTNAFGGQQSQNGTINQMDYMTINNDVKRLEEGVNDYTKRIQKVSKDMELLGNSILMYIEQRKTADLARKTALDAQIKTLQADYNALMNQQKTYEQQRIQLSNKLNMARGIQTQINNQKDFAKYGGMSTVDDTKMAMDLRNTIEANNEKVDESNTNASIASVDINTDSFSDIGFDAAMNGAADDDWVNNLENMLKGNPTGTPGGSN